MSDWKEYSISELCTDIIDCVNKTAPISPLPTPYRMLRTSDIRNGFINLENLNCVAEEVFTKWTRRGALQEGDVIFTREAPLGEAGIVREARNYFLGQRLVLYRANPAVCDNRFLLYWFLNPINKEGLKTRGVGSTVSHMRVPECERIKVTAPPLQIQHRIADILSAYDDLIETNQRQIKLLEEAAQRLYKEWFVDLRYPGHTNVPVVDGVPEGWEKQKLIQQSNVLRRGISPAYNVNGKYVVISQKCIRSAIMNIEESRRQDKEYPEELNLQDGDTVICSTGIGTLGRIGQVFGEYPNTTFDSHVTVVRAKQHPNYHYHAIKSQEEYLMGMGRGSTNQQELYRNVIESLDILIPTDEVLSKAEELLASIHEKITTLKDENVRLTEARDRLLPKLMSGEITV